MIRLSGHALKRLRQRAPSWTEQDCETMAEIAMRSGLVAPGGEGVNRFRFLRLTFVVDVTGETPVVITLY